MGIIYTVLLQDDFDWNYNGTNKQKKIKELQASFEKLKIVKPTLLGEWYGFMVLNFYKTPIFMDEYAKIILKYCDSCHYWNDINPYEIKKIKHD